MDSYSHLVNFETIRCRIMKHYEAYEPIDFSIESYPYIEYSRNFQNDMWKILVSIHLCPKSALLLKSLNLALDIELIYY
jgi:hypothetical protein